MRIVLSCLLVLAALGCQQTTAPADLDPNLNARDRDGALTTDKESYAPGSTVALRLSNVYQHGLGYNLCHSTLERRAGSSWRKAEFENERVCTMELRTLQPGANATFNHRLDARISEGEYRYRTSAENLSSGGRLELVSNTFRVTR